MFFFKDLEDPNGFNISKKRDMINELISITGMQRKVSENERIEIQNKDSKNMKNYPPKRKEKDKEEDLYSGEESNKKDIQIYNSSRKKVIESKGTKTTSYLKQGDSEEKKKYKKKSNPYLYDDKYEENSKNNYDDIYPKYEESKMKRNKNIRNRYNFNFNDKIVSNFSESIGTNIEYYSSYNDVPKKRKKKLKVENSFNVFEVIITQFFKCCICGNMKIKNEVNEKANELLFKKMDIITHVRNQLLFDVINQIIIDDNKKPLINFLGRPAINLDKNKKTKGPFDEFYKNYSEKDFNKYFDMVKEITQKQEKNENETKLISMSQKHLRAFAL